MAKHTLGETTEWVAGNLRKEAKVSKVEVLSEQVLLVSRDKYDPYIAGIISATCVDVASVSPLVISDSGIEIIVNIPKESYWSGEAIRLAHEKNIATGCYGDLFRVIDVQDVRAFEPKETAFIERGLRQHARITGFKRVFDRVYCISRRGLPDITVAMLNEYELTADHLRTARAWYGFFSVAVLTNPNGGATTSAARVAETMGVEILDWETFFGRLWKK